MRRGLDTSSSLKYFFFDAPLIMAMSPVGRNRLTFAKLCGQHPKVAAPSHCYFTPKVGELDFLISSLVSHIRFNKILRIRLESTTCRGCAQAHFLAIHPIKWKRKRVLNFHIVRPANYFPDRTSFASFEVQ